MSQFEKENEIYHIDNALKEVFSGHGKSIHELKISNAHFSNLMVKNHSLWNDIKNIENEIVKTSDDVLNKLEKERLAILDEMSLIINAHEAEIA